MLTKINYDLITNEKPYSKIVGCYELVIPLYNINVEVYIEKEESLAPILDSVFSLYYLNYDIEEISNFLGTDQEVIKNGVFELIDMDYIDYISRKVTDKGRKYYVDKKVVNFDRRNINLVINKLTGEILSNESHSYSSRTDMLDLNGKTKYLDNSDVNINELLTLKQVRKIWSERSVWDEKKYYGDILEIVEIKERDNVYLKEDIVYLIEENKNVELLSFYRNKRDTKLENFLYANEFDDPKITNNHFSTFFQEYVLDNKIKYFSQNKNNSTAILDLNILKKAKSSVTICIPLVEFITISEEIILILKTLAKRNIHVNIYISGWDFIDAHQRTQFAKLVSKNKKTFSIYSLNTFVPQIIILDDEKAIETKFVVNEIKPKFKEITCVNLEHVELSGNEIKEVVAFLKSNGIKKFRVPKVENINNSTVNNVIDNLYKVDELLTKEGYGWLSEKYPNIRDEEVLRNFDRITTAQDLKNFLSICNISLIESFREKSENHKDFENRFSKDYPELFNVLNRIKIYRHYFLHGQLTPYNYELFIKYIRDDLNGYFLNAIENSFEVIFLTIISKLNVALLQIIEEFTFKE